VGQHPKFTIKNTKMNPKTQKRDNLLLKTQNLLSKNPKTACCGGRIGGIASLDRFSGETGAFSYYSHIKRIFFHFFMAKIAIAPFSTQKRRKIL
jgi:hypothetical protein